MAVKTIKYYTKVRAELLNKAVDEYLERHPEEVNAIKATRSVSENESLPEIHGSDWEGWRKIQLGKHKKDDWVVGHICSWRGTTSNDEEKVPGCVKEIAPYKYNGDKYIQYCCDLHALYPQAAYTIEEIKHNIRIVSGLKNWVSPINVHWLSVLIEKLEKGLPIHYVCTKDAVVLFNHPIMQAKYPQIYTKDLIALIKGYRNMDHRIAKMMKADMDFRGISLEKTAFIYGLSIQEVKDAIASI